MSSVAMNRRISRDSGIDSNNFNISINSNETQLTSISGTPLQQQYRILNMHERRLNRVFDQVHVLTSKLNDLESKFNLRLHRLEQENASLRKQMASLMKAISSKNGNTVSLSVNEKN